MRLVSKLCLWLALAVFVTSSAAFADDDDDKVRSKASAAKVAELRANNPEIGDCEVGTASAFLDGNNVRARLYNDGGLFWKSSGFVYTVPKEGIANSVFASGIWIGGIDTDGDLRFAGRAYGDQEYWPGPLDDSGDPPSDCNPFDRIYKVTKTDIEAYEINGTIAGDLADWPFELGAPVVDGDGNVNNYDLAGGDRPEVVGEQVAWWVMNDVGNVKTGSQTDPIGLEVQVTAFAFNTADALNNTTFYKYKLIHKGDEPLTDVYFGLWSDPDLGDASDDFVGSDTTLGLGIVYNGGEFDSGVDGYGAAPPALAYDYFQGPLVVDPDGGTHVDPDGTVHPGMKRIQMTKFVYYNNDASAQGNPSFATTEPYDYLRGVWRDGSPITFGGSGYNSGEPTDYMFPGNPATRSYWSEENTDNAGSRNTPADRRFLMSSGPFELVPGDVQEIVYGIVWSQSLNRLASVAQLKFDDIFAQGAYNSNFDIPAPPNAPDVSVDVADRSLIIEWTNEPTDNNYLNSYDQQSAFLANDNPPDGNTTYTFEGYRILQYESPSDQNGTPVVTFDVINNVTTIVDQQIDVTTGALITEVVANGSDSGVRNFIELNNLTNGRTYYYGIQAYAYNPNSLPKVYASPVNRFSAIPSPSQARGTTFRADLGTVLSSTRTAGTGDSFGVFATVANPSKVTGASYTVEVFDVIDPNGDGDTSDGIGEVVGTDDDGNAIRAYIFNAGTSAADTVYAGDDKAQTYRLSSSTAGVIFSGATYIVQNDTNLPFGEDLLTIDGLSFGVDTAPADFKAFSMVANADGPIDPILGAAADYNGFPTLPYPDGAGGFTTWRANSGDQQVGDGTWFFHTGDNGARASYEAFLGRSIRNGFGPIVPYDFEQRFTQACYDAWLAVTGTQAEPAADPYAYLDDLSTAPAGACWAYDRFGVGDGDQNFEPTIVPYELWNIGIATEDDPSDDFRMIPAVIDWDGDGYDMQVFDHSSSSLDNDPESDWTYWLNPCNAACTEDDFTPGQAGYERWRDNILSKPVGSIDQTELTGGEVMARTVLVNWNGGSVAADPFVIDQDMVEPGSVIRLTTTKPLANGDSFTIDASSVRPIAVDESTDIEGALSREDIIAFYQEQVGIVPNPYKGSSSYEVSLAEDQVRFVNLPETATIRIFTLDGTLVRTLIKNSSEPTFNWDLETDADLPIASGMYLVHIDMGEFGEKVVKFGVVKKRIQLDLF